MRHAGLRGLPERKRWRGRPDTPSVADLVDRNFAVIEPDVLWVTDVTEHPTHEGKLYCSVVLDAYSRRVVGWSIDASQTAALVTNALGMEDQGVKQTGANSHRVLAPHMGVLAESKDARPAEGRCRRCSQMRPDPSRVRSC